MRGLGGGGLHGLRLTGSNYNCSRVRRRSGETGHGMKEERGGGYCWYI